MESGKIPRQVLFLPNLNLLFISYNTAKNIHRVSLINTYSLGDILLILQGYDINLPSVQSKSTAPQDLDIFEAGV